MKHLWILSIQTSLPDTCSNHEDLKKQLRLAKDKSQIVKQIKEVLVQNHIAFLDVMKYAIRKSDSSRDDGIQYACLDVENFSYAPTSAYFICNSKLAETGYLQICNQLLRQPNHEYLAQSWQHLYKNDTKTKWIETIKRLCAL